MFTTLHNKPICYYNPATFDFDPIKRMWHFNLHHNVPTSILMSFHSLAYGAPLASVMLNLLSKCHRPNVVQNVALTKCMRDQRLKFIKNWYGDLIHQFQKGKPVVILK